MSQRHGLAIKIMASREPVSRDALAICLWICVLYIAILCFLQTRVLGLVMMFP